MKILKIAFFLILIFIFIQPAEAAWPPGGNPLSATIRPWIVTCSPGYDENEVTHMFRNAEDVFEDYTFRRLTQYTPTFLELGYNYISCTDWDTIVDTDHSGNLTVEEHPNLYNNWYDSNADVNAYFVPDTYHQVTFNVDGVIPNASVYIPQTLATPSAYLTTPDYDVVWESVGTTGSSTTHLSAGNILNAWGVTKAKQYESSGPVEDPLLWEPWVVYGSDYLNAGAVGGWCSNGYTWCMGSRVTYRQQAQMEAVHPASIYYNQGFVDNMIPLNTSCTGSEFTWITLKNVQSFPITVKYWWIGQFSDSTWFNLPFTSTFNPGQTKRFGWSTPQEARFLKVHRTTGTNDDLWFEYSNFQDYCE